MLKRDSRYTGQLPVNAEKGEETKKPTLICNVLQRTDILCSN